MKSLAINYQINQPEVTDYEKSYPRMPCNTPKKQAIFDIIIDVENIHRAIIVAEETSNSPVAVYESKISNAIDNGTITSLTWHERQFVGTTICLVMESNGWSKTGKKQRFSKGIFKSGEIYYKQKSYPTSVTILTGR